MKVPNGTLAIVLSFVKDGTYYKGPWDVLLYVTGFGLVVQSWYDGMYMTTVDTCN